MLKNLKPIVIYSDKFLNAISILFPIGGISIFPVVVLKERYIDPDSDFWIKKGKEVVNHETIHFQQQLELGVLLFYLLYLLEWLLKLPFYGSRAYNNISFEREAYSNEGDLGYLQKRKRYVWLKIVFK